MTLIAYLIYKMRCEIREVKVKSEEEVFQLHNYVYYLSKYEQKMKEEHKEQQEKDLMLRLMKKYGYSTDRPLDCPF